MKLCLVCSAYGKRPNCANCRSLSPLPEHRRIADAARSMVREFRDTDPEIQEQRRKAAEFYAKEEIRVAKVDAKRNAWKKHDRITHSGAPCPLNSCPCKEAAK